MGGEIGVKMMLQSGEKIEKGMKEERKKGMKNWVKGVVGEG